MNADVKMKRHKHKDKYGRGSKNEAYNFYEIKPRRNKNNNLNMEDQQASKNEASNDYNELEWQRILQKKKEEFDKKYAKPGGDESCLQKWERIRTLGTGRSSSVVLLFLLVLLYQLVFLLLLFLLVLLLLLLFWLSLSQLFYFCCSLQKLVFAVDVVVLFIFVQSAKVGLLVHTLYCFLCCCRSVSIIWSSKAVFVVVVPSAKVGSRLVLILLC